MDSSELNELQAKAALGVRPRITADFQSCFEFTGLRPFRPRPSPRRAPLPSTCGGGVGGSTPNLQEVVRQADQLPFGGHLLQATQQKLTDATRRFDLAEHRLDDVLARR